MIALVTDSTAYLTKAEADSMGISVVPTHYIAGEVQYSESFSDQNGDFGALVDNSASRTSHPAPDDFLVVFQELLRQGKEVVCVVMSSRLSGTYSSARIAAKAVKSGVTVIDSLSTAGGLALLVSRAADMVRDGASALEIERNLENLKAGIGIAFSVESMEPLRRSNRIGFVPQAIGTILNIRPLLLLRHGTIVANGIVRGGRERIRRIVDSINPAATELVVHCIKIDSGEDMEVLYAAVRERFPDANISQSRLGPVMGIHLGSGAIGVSWIV